MTALDRGIARQALYYVGLAHERLSRPDVAASTYRELLADPNLPAEVRELATAGLKRVSE